MPRERQRVCLQDGIKLDLNRLARRQFICRGGFTSGRGIVWRNSYWGVVASATISADMSGENHGWLQLDGDFHERITLTTRPRHYGGKQWFFLCPTLNRPVSILWRPPGAKCFASRQSFGRQVAYQSQYLDRASRAHHQQSKINNRLCELGGYDPDDWDFPPKPKWMRQITYERIEAKFDRQEDILDGGLAVAAARLIAKWKC